MIQDQASSLRNLKRLRDHQAQESLPTKDGFLEGLPRPTPFPAIALVLPERGAERIPPLQDWAHKLIGGASRACFWDQAGVGPPRAAIPAEDQLLPCLTTLESDGGPLLVLHRIPGLGHLPRFPDADRMKFARSLFRSLSSISQLWIVLKAGELARSQGLLHATDQACILVPDDPEAILSSYEALKAVHLSGYFSPLRLIGFRQSPVGGSAESLERLRTVARQFLALDLGDTGVILSDQDPETRMNARLRGLVENLDPTTADFQFAFGERLLFPSPGDLE